MARFVTFNASADYPLLADSTAHDPWGLCDDSRRAIVPLSMGEFETKYLESYTTASGVESTRDKNWAWNPTCSCLCACSTAIEVELGTISFDNGTETDTYTRFLFEDYKCNGTTFAGAAALQKYLAFLAYDASCELGFHVLFGGSSISAKTNGVPVGITNGSMWYRSDPGGGEIMTEATFDGTFDVTKPTGTWGATTPSVTVSGWTNHRVWNGVFAVDSELGELTANNEILYSPERLV